VPYVHHIQSNHGPHADCHVLPALIIEAAGLVTLCLSDIGALKQTSVQLRPLAETSELPEATLAPEDDAIADALLEMWLRDNQRSAAAADAAEYVDLTDSSDWQHVGLPQRADCQALLMHPCVLARSRKKLKMLHGKCASGNIMDTICKRSGYVAAQY
jgi:hypothetical protein